MNWGAIASSNPVRREESSTDDKNNNGEKEAIYVDLDLDDLDLLQLVASIGHFKCAVDPEMYLVYLVLERTDDSHRCQPPAKWRCS